MPKITRVLQEQQAHQLAQKLALEKQVTPKIAAQIERMANDLAAVYKASGVLLNANDFKAGFERELTAHYDETATRFTAYLNNRVVGDPSTDAIAKAFKNYAQKRGKSMQDAINHLDHVQQDRLGKFIKQSVNRATDQITVTNASAIEKAVTRSVANVVNAGNPVTHETVGDELASVFMQSNEWRAEIIAQYETQNAAEGAKSVAADSINEVITNAEPSFVAVYLKEWVTVGDEKVRDWHADADGQTVNVDEPFIVMGEELMFPSDDSMGASPENTINCRCSSEYVENPNFDNSTSEGE